MIDARDVHRLLASAFGAPATSARGPDWAGFYERLREARDRADVDLLSALALALEHPAPDLPLPPGGGAPLLELTVRALALIPTSAAAERLLGLASLPDLFPPRPRAHRDAAARLLGAILAQAHTEDTLVAMLRLRGDAPAHRDLFACWIQEAVLRGRQLAPRREIQRFQGALEHARHPLASLPLALLSIEREAPAHAARYDVTSAGGWGAGLPRPQPPEDDPVWPPGRPLPAPLDATRPEDAAWIEAAADSAREVSNGRSEGRVFLLDPPAPPGLITSELLCSLPLACLSGAAPAAVRVRPLSPEQAFSALLWAGANGGDCNIAWSGAHGRRAAWRSLAGLLDRAGSRDHASIEERARSCSFAHFDAETGWFDRVATDLGLVALHPGGGAITVLAYTDTD